MRRNAKIYSWCWSATLLMAGLTGCGGDRPLPTANMEAEDAAVSPGVGQPTAPATLVNSSRDEGISSPVPSRNLFPEVLIKTTAGDIRVRLNAEAARVTVENFLDNYVDRGFYAGTIFHHVEAGFLLAAGGFTSDLQAQPTRAPVRNEAVNGLKNKRGTLAMARMGQYADSATSQFYINLVDNPAMDYDAATGNDGYCVFGEVVSGLDVVDRIATVPVHATGEFDKLPVEAVVITAIERIGPQ